MVDPVALQDNFSKAPFAAREQHVLQMRPDMAQRAINQETAGQHILDQSRTLPTEEPGPGEMRLENQEEKRRGQRDQKNQQPAEEEGSSESGGPEENGSSPRIDIIA